MEVDLQTEEAYGLMNFYRCFTKDFIYPRRLPSKRLAGKELPLKQRKVRDTAEGAVTRAE